jgi:hypothetical protein
MVQLYEASAKDEEYFLLMDKGACGETELVSRQEVVIENGQSSPTTMPQ